MIAIKQAKPAGTSGASIHPGLTPSQDLLALMHLSLLVFSTTPPIVQHFIRLWLVMWANIYIQYGVILKRFMSLIQFKTKTIITRDIDFNVNTRGIKSTQTEYSSKIART